jgi:hypothetical protein
MAIEAQSFYAGSIDVQVSKPLDAREYVKTEEDLIKQDTWSSLSGGSFLWKGMQTYVKDVGCWYELISEPYGEAVIGKDGEGNDIEGYSYQKLESWKKVKSLVIDDENLSNGSTYSSNKIHNLIESINKFNIKVVETLPETGEKFVIYLVPIQETSEQEEPATQISDTYNEYIWITDDNGENGKWELIGTTKVNLDDYYTKTDVDTLLEDVNTSADALEARVEVNEGAIANLQGEIVNKAEQDSLNTLVGRVEVNEGKITTLEEHIDEVDGRITTTEGNITTLQGEIANKASQTDLTAEVEAREALAERVTTTEGEIDTLQTTKANTSDVYTKTEVDTIVSNIEDKDTTYTAGENIEIEDNSISATGYTFERGRFCINKNGEKVVINKNRSDFDWIIPYEDNQSSTLISYVGSDENYDFNEIITIEDKIIFYDEGSGIINPYIECSVIEINPKNFLVDKKIYLSPVTTSVYKPGFVVAVKNNGDVYIKGIGGFGDENEMIPKSLQEYLLEQQIKVVNVYEVSSTEMGDPLNWPDADLYHYCDTANSDIFFTKKDLSSVIDDGLKPNTFYRWNNSINGVFHISFDSSSYNEYSEYMAEFKTSTTNTSLSFGKINGGNIIFTDNSDLQIIAGKTYQLSVLNNIGILINA